MIVVELELLEPGPSLRSRFSVSDEPSERCTFCSLFERLPSASLFDDSFFSTELPKLSLRFSDFSIELEPGEVVVVVPLSIVPLWARAGAEISASARALAAQSFSMQILRTGYPVGE
jgi:hypothetical protein